MPFSEAFCGLFARRVLSVQLWEAVKASGTKTCGLNVCVLLCFPCASCSNVGLSSARGRCHFQLIWLGVAVTLQARPAFSLPRLRLCVCRFRGFGLLAAACAHLWRRPRCVCAAFALLWLRVACPHLKRRSLLWLLLPALRIVARWRLPKVAQSLLQSVPVLLSARGRRLCCDHGAAKAWCLLCFFRFGLRLCRRFAELAGHAGWQRLGRQPAGSQSGVEESCGQRGFRQVLLPASECVAAACFYLLRVWALPI